MSVTSNINEKANQRIVSARQQQADQVGDPYFAAARNSVQSSYRFLLRIEGIPFALIDSVSRPTPKFNSVKEFQLLNWKFKNPGGVVGWNDIKFTIKEIFDNTVSDSVAGILLNKFKLLAWDNPNQVNRNNLKDMSKSDLMASLGDVIIQIIDPDGKVYEQWVLYDSFVSKISFGELGYNKETLLSSTVTISYDWASLTYVNNIGQTKTY